MAQLRIDSSGQRLFQAFDSFRDDAKPIGMPLRIGSTLFVTDDREAFAKGGGELG